MFVEVILLFPPLTDIYLSVGDFRHCIKGFSALIMLNGLFKLASYRRLVLRYAEELTCYGKLSCFIEKHLNFWFPIKFVLESCSALAAGNAFRLGKLQTLGDEIFYEEICWER